MRRVWVGLEGSYAAGRLIGEWVEACDLDEEGVAELLTRLQVVDPDGGEELSIMDQEGWGPVDPKAFPLHRLARLDEMLDDRPEAAALLGAHGSHYYDDPDDLEKGLDNVSIYGPYRSEEDYVEQLMDNGVIEIPEHLRSYIDTERMARDYCMDATNVWVDDELWLVFG